MAKHDRAPQTAAIAVREQKICLVTTRSGRGLIIPKGNVPPGACPAELAAREAWEEAGLIGHIGPEPFGKYTYRKADHVQTVQVFILRVTRAARVWPEQRIRRRLWYSLEDAGSLVTHRALQSLIEEFARSEIFAGSPAARRRRKCA
jgi:8-oxo-dGTP pyrophosphatase MutT (NUDIX family)